MTRLRDVAVSGVYATKQARRIDDIDSMRLTLQAIEGALADAGVDRTEVDGAAVDWPGPGGSPGDPASLATFLGRPLSWTGSDGFFDNAGVRGIAKAASAIATGLCEVVVLGGATAGRAAGARNSTVTSSSGNQFRDTWGAFVAPMFAMVAQRHMYQFGTTNEQIATVSATIRNNATTNPEAVMFGKGPYTVDDVLASPVISSPLHLLDICIVAQGGAAVVLTTADRARDLPQAPVRILGAGLEYAEAAYLQPPLYRTVGSLGREACARAFRQAGVAPADVDVFSLYDPNSFEIIRQMEAIALCKEGEGGDYVTGGTLAIGGAAPTNLDGGTLAHSWNRTQQMTLRVIEAVRQLRGTAVHQVPGARIAAASNAGAGAAHYEFMLLGTD
jgi:acetyl-CoA acetyltransferase